MSSNEYQMKHVTYGPDYARPGSRMMGFVLLWIFGVCIIAAAVVAAAERLIP